MNDKAQGAAAPDQEPGRSCPLHYCFTPDSLVRDPDVHADTLYVVGGAYG